MIEIGKNLGWALARTRQAARTQKEKYQALAGQAQNQAQALQEQYALQNTYLFRSAAERMRQAQQTARQALAQRQAARASHGVAQSSASAVEDGQTTQLAQRLQHAQTQVQLQTQGAQAEKNFRTRWQQFLQAARDYRRSARKKSSLGSLGRAFISLFN